MISTSSDTPSSSYSLTSTAVDSFADGRHSSDEASSTRDLLRDEKRERQSKDDGYARAKTTFVCTVIIAAYCLVFFVFICVPDTVIDGSEPKYALGFHIAKIAMEIPLVVITTVCRFFAKMDLRRIRVSGYISLGAFISKINVIEHWTVTAGLGACLILCSISTLLFEDRNGSLAGEEEETCDYPGTVDGIILISILACELIIVMFCEALTMRRIILHNIHREKPDAALYIGPVKRRGRGSGKKGAEKKYSSLSAEVVELQTNMINLLMTKISDIETQLESLNEEDENKKENPSAYSPVSKMSDEGNVSEACARLSSTLVTLEGESVEKKKEYDDLKKLRDSLKEKNTELKETLHRFESS